MCVCVFVWSRQAPFMCLDLSKLDMELFDELLEVIGTIDFGGRANESIQKNNTQLNKRQK